MFVLIKSWLWGFAMRRVMSLWNDTRVRGLVVGVVENLVHVDLNNDGKIGVATENIKIELKAIGISEGAAVCSQLAELAVQKLKKV
jgi:hypothetical protein